MVCKMSKQEKTDSSNEDRVKDMWIRFKLWIKCLTILSRSRVLEVKEGDIVFVKIPPEGVSYDEIDGMQKHFENILLQHAKNNGLDIEKISVGVISNVTDFFTMRMKK